VGIATEYWLDDGLIEVRISAGAGIFPTGYGGSFVRGKAAGA
jgi:hypothetical protein